MIVIFVTQLIHLKIFENLQLIILKLIINYVFAHGFHLPIFQRSENELTKRRVFAESAAQDGYAGVEA